MTADLYSPTLGQIKLFSGWPKRLEGILLPFSEPFHMQHERGSIMLQEVKMEHFLLRYFIFDFNEPVTLFGKEKGEGLQSIFSLKGSIRHGLKGDECLPVNEGQFTVFNGGVAETETIIPGGKPCHILSTYYKGPGYSDFLDLFPELKKDLDRNIDGARFLVPFPRYSRHTVSDSFREILVEKYRGHLQKAFWELKLRQVLFTLLAQTYTERTPRSSSRIEKEMACKAKAIIEEDISRHYSNMELARKVGWSLTSLKKAFSNEFGQGMFEYLRSLRMKKARELLENGEQIKGVAAAVGMRPSNFSVEFRNYFGFNASRIGK